MCQMRRGEFAILRRGCLDLFGCDDSALLDRMVPVVLADGRGEMAIRGISLVSWSKSWDYACVVSTVFLHAELCVYFVPGRVLGSLG